MGEVADMMLDGTLCVSCGVYIEQGEAQGFPRKCKHCQEDDRPKGKRKKGRRR